MADSASKRAAVLGHPIAHSLSPVLHRAAYEALGLNWTYERVDITGDNLADFMAGLDETWAGLSLTMPLKRDVLALLDHADPLVSATGAANTVVLTNGRRYGFNTDVDGLVRALGQPANPHRRRPGRWRDRQIRDRGACPRGCLISHRLCQAP